MAQSDGHSVGAKRPAALVGADVPAIERARQFYVDNNVRVPFEIELGEYLRAGHGGN